MHHFVSGALTPTAAGADFKYMPSTSNSWKLVALTAKIVTSAVVANRSPVLEVLDQQGTLAIAIPASATQAASLTVTYNWYIAGAPSPGAGAAIGGFASAVLPNIWFPPGWSIKALTGLIDVGDQWSSVYATWLESDNPSTGELNALLSIYGG